MNNKGNPVTSVTGFFCRIKVNLENDEKYDKF